jgi:ComF family protein
LSQKFWGRTSIKYTLAFLKFTKEGKVQRILHQLKYKGQREIGEMLGNWYGAELTESGFSRHWDLILPVPLHESKLRKRGYNQSDGFAKGLSESMEVAWSDKVLQRKTATKTQTKKGRWERWQNVEEIFVITEEEMIQKKNILLVDDIITTGATLEACAIELYNKGCKSVSVATIAVAM